MVPSIAHAQEGQPQAQAAKPGDSGEIVVTARRKNEALTTVPAAITSYSADFLEKQNIQSFEEYATKVPNLSFQYGQGPNALWAGDRQTTIRGVVGDNTTAYYIDDTPVPSSVSPNVLSLDRIEVLKGPQGTLFGASSMGGNMRFITRKPSLDENSGSVRYQGGVTETAGLDLDANVRQNLILARDRVAINATAGYSHLSGYITRRFPNDAGGFVSKGEEGRSDTVSGSVALRAKLTETLEASVNLIGQRTRLKGFPGAYLPVPSYRQRSYTVDRDKDIQEFSNDDWGLGAFVLSYAGKGFSVVSSTSLFRREIYQLDDNTEASNYFVRQVVGVNVGNPAFYLTTKQNERRITHETRLSFDDGTILPGLSGILGVYYQNQRVRFYNAGIYVRELADAGFPAPYLADVPRLTHEENKAVFGELYYKPLSRMTVTLGLRQYWVSQKEDPTLYTGLLFGAGSAKAAIRNRESGLIPKVVASYEIGDRGNVYGSIAKGFRAGASGAPLPAFCNADLAALGVDPANAGRYRSDTLWSYEVGAKSRLANGRLNAAVAAFRLDWSDIQQSANLPQCALSFVTNAGKARIDGGELELGGRPFADVPLTLQLGLGYANAKLIDPGVLRQPANSRLGLVPRWTASVSAYYEAPVSPTANLFLSADYSYTSSVPVPDAGNGSATFLTRQPIELINGNIGVRLGKAKVMLYGKNLLDKRLNLGDQRSAGFERRDLMPDGSYQRLLRGMVSRPRQIGIQVQLDY